VVADFDAMTETAVWIPLTFVTPTDVQVTSRYEPAYQALFAQGVTLSNRSPAELQRMGAAGLAWLLYGSPGASAAHLPNTGTLAHTTSYTRADYVFWSRAAANFDFTLAEMQKVGALFFSWLLAGRPPLPGQ
jgi:hypothetical protein